MKLLIITQKVDKKDPILGFFHDWITEFSKHCDEVSVLCLEKGEYDLPKNVSVYSLGKEDGVSRSTYIFRFFWAIFSLRNRYDSVFVHMNYEYVILGGLFWRMWHKKVALWYVHRQRSMGLWFSEKLVNTVFTSSLESFCIQSKKTIYVGHGIDTARFVCQSDVRDPDKTKIIHIGRITPIKNLETLILAGEILSKKIPNMSVEFFGEASSDTDKKYFEQLKKMIQDKSLASTFTFRGGVPNSEIPIEYCKASLSVNMTPTGGWDKVVVESLVAGCPVFASNIALKPVFGEYVDRFLFEYNNPLDLAYKIEQFLVLENRNSIIQNLHNHTVREYDFKNLIKRISLALVK